MRTSDTTASCTTNKKSRSYSKKIAFESDYDVVSAAGCIVHVIDEGTLNQQQSANIHTPAPVLVKKVVPPAADSVITVSDCVGNTNAAEVWRVRFHEDSMAAMQRDYALKREMNRLEKELEAQSKTLGFDDQKLYLDREIEVSSRKAQVQMQAQQYDKTAVSI